MRRLWWRRRIVDPSDRALFRPCMVTRRRRVTSRMAVNRAAMHPVVNKRIPSPIDKPRPNPGAIRIAEANIACRSHVIDNSRVIFGNINIFLLNGLNRDIVVNRHSNLVVALQIAVLVSGLAHALHGIHHIGLLHFDGFAKLVRPSRVFCEFSQNIRERNQRYDRFVITQFRIFNGFCKVIPLQVPVGLGKSGCIREVIAMR